MAATDQHYRSQKTLDVVFGVSCVLMLLSTSGCSSQDYNRDYKAGPAHLPRRGSGARRAEMLDKLPDTDTGRRRSARAGRGRPSAGLDKAQAKVGADDERAADGRARQGGRRKYRDIKADFDAESSYLQHRRRRAGKDAADARRKALQGEAEHMRKRRSSSRSRSDSNEAQDRPRRDRRRDRGEGPRKRGRPTRRRRRWPTPRTT